MSLILDALKRAERERGEILSPFADPDPSALGPARRRFRWWKLAVVLAVIAGVAGSAWYYRKSGPRVHTAPVSIVTAPARPPKPAPKPLETPAPAAVIPGTEGMASLDELTRPGAAVDSAAAPAAAPGADKGDVSPFSTTPAAETTAEAQAPTATESEIPPEEPPTANPPPALTQPAPLRRFREMTPEFRADFPALAVEVHVFERAVAQRWVIVNGRRYKEGDRLSEGPVLKEIVANGMVLEFRGEKLLYPLTR